MAPELVALATARPALAGWLERHDTLIDAAASAPDAERLRGRGRVVSVSAPGRGPGERWVVRHYHRGGAVTGVLGDRYLRMGVPRPFREFGLLQALSAAEVPAVRAVGAAVYPAGAFYRGDLVTEWVAGSEDLAGVLFGAAQLDEVADGGDERAAGPSPTEAMAAAGGLVRRLHEGGVVHPDLNLKNILLAPGEGRPRALAVDLDGARIRPVVGRAARRRMLARFERSLRKWEERAGGPAPGGCREAFRAGYEEAAAERGPATTRGDRAR